MSRNFIFSARKQGGSAQNLNLRCGPDASKRSFGAHRDPGTYEHGHLPSARCDDLGARRNELLRGGRCYDVGAGGHRLLRDTKCYDFVVCIDRLFLDIGCCDLSASGYSLSQDIGHRGFITPKYELRSRANCDYSVSMLLNDAVCCGFTARNSAKFSSDTYCGYSVSVCLRRVGTNRDVHSRRDSGANVRLRSSTSDRLRRASDRPARAACLHCGFGAQHSAQKAVLSAYRSLFCDEIGRAHV